MKSLQSVRKYKSWMEFQDLTNISLRNRYIFFAIGKVANTTIKKCLFDIEYEGQRREALSLFDKRASPLLSPFQLPDEEFLSILNGKRFFKFAIVRNPYSRLLSCYLDRILTKSSHPSRTLRRYLAAAGFDPEPLTFDIFVRAICRQTPPEMNAHWRVQYDDICYPEIEFDFIGHFEHLWDDLAVVSNRIWGEVRPQFTKHRNISYSPKQTRASSRLHEYYTDELAQLVYKHYGADFETFGYSDSLDHVDPER